MVNLEWKNIFELGGRQYHILEESVVQAPDKFHFKQGDRIPFIACFTGLDHLRVDSMLLQFRRSVPVDLLLEIFKSGANVVKVKIRGASYLVGKGLLMDVQQQILLMLTVTEAFYRSFSPERALYPEEIATHFTLFVHYDLISDGRYAAVFNKFKRLLQDVSFDVIYTCQPERNVFVSREFPRFRTLEDRQDFIQQMRRELIQKVLIDQVV